MTKEQDLQTKIIKYLKSKNYYVIKTIICSKSGIPDIIACDPSGQFVAIEVKQLKGKATPLQLYNIRTINANNGLAFIARSLEDVKYFIP